MSVHEPTVPSGVTPHPVIGKRSNGNPCTHPLLPEQVAKLLEAIHPGRVVKLPKPGDDKRKPTGPSYVAQHDIRAHLTRIFGFGFWGDRVTFIQGPLFEEQVNGNWQTAYIAGVDVWIRCSQCGGTITSYGDVNGAGNMPQKQRADAHTLAVTTAVSTALKRAAINLGDQFGLSLYDKGRVTAFVLRTLVHPLSQDGTPQVLNDVDVSGEVDELGNPAFDGEEVPEHETVSVEGHALMVALQDLPVPAGERIKAVVALRKQYGHVLGEYANVNGSLVTLDRLTEMASQGRMA